MLQLLRLATFAVTDNSIVVQVAFDEKSPSDLLQLLTNVLGELDSAHRVRK